MATTLTAVESNRRQAARQEFVAACWKGKPAVDLLPLAEAAGMSAADADALAGEIAQGKQDKTLADALPRLRREADKAQAAFDKINAKAQAEIERLENAVQSAGFAAEDARRPVHDAEAAARRLALLADRGDVPADMLPQEVFDTRRREAGERKRYELHAAQVQARRTVEDRRAYVQHLTDCLRELPIRYGPDPERQAIEARLAAAQDALKAAEGQLQQATAAYERAAG
jgi:hypothetical protein